MNVVGGCMLTFSKYLLTIFYSSEKFKFYPVFMNFAFTRNPFIITFMVLLIIILCHCICGSLSLSVRVCVCVFVYLCLYVPLSVSEAGFHYFTSFFLDQAPILHSTVCYVRMARNVYLLKSS
jgi:hypothetical protein